MELPRDPAIFFSFINTKLRDEYPSLDAFCEAADVPKDELLARMSSVGYTYLETRNQFIRKCACGSGSRAPL